MATITNIQTVALRVSANSLMGIEILLFYRRIDTFGNLIDLRIRTRIYLGNGSRHTRYDRGCNTRSQVMSSEIATMQFTSREGSEQIRAPGEANW